MTGGVLSQEQPPSLHRATYQKALIHTVSMPIRTRSEEHTFELQSLRHLVCRLLLEKKIMIRQAGAPSGRIAFTEHTIAHPAGHGVARNKNVQHIFVVDDSLVEAGEPSGSRAGRFAE